MMPKDETLDLTKGIYRRIYAGFLMGRRINAVSMEAEAWFWRLHAIADDFGNLPGDPDVLRSLASPRRNITVKQVVSWVSELENAALLRAYEFGSESYLHIDGFEFRQPGGRNGKRIKKVPPYKGGEESHSEDGSSWGNPGESGGIPGNPGAAGKSQQHNHHHHHHPDSHSHSHSHHHHQRGGAGGEPGGGGEFAALTPEQGAVFRHLVEKHGITAKKARELACGIAGLTIAAVEACVAKSKPTQPGGVVKAVQDGGRYAVEEAERRQRAAAENLARLAASEEADRKARAERLANRKVTT